MKHLITALLLLILGQQARAEIYECNEHKNILEVQKIGFEHINHIVQLNKSIQVKELMNGLWFIENIKCTQSGFLITASHAQYNMPIKKNFSLIINDKGDYAIE